MATSVLDAKIVIPLRNPAVIHRKRLLDLLDGAEHNRLILVNAPAGYGKTSLVCEWCHETTGKAAWFSIDRSDNDVLRFLTYLIYALQKIHPPFCHLLLGTIAQAEPVPLQQVLTILLNELSLLPFTTRIILDDYHLVEDEKIHEAIIFLLEHLPGHIQLIITSRTEPPFPLHRWRAQRQLAEIRAHDLRFTIAETHELLNQSMELELTPDEIQMIGARAEGWVTGLQMSGIALQSLLTQGIHRSDFMRSFSGSHRYILDYFREEVILQQPPHIQRFLVHTALLDRLTAPLCNAILQIEDSREIIAHLEIHNLFIIPLDGNRQWYRYHALFIEILQDILANEDPAILPELHWRAAQWYAQNNAHYEAISHAIASGKSPAAINLAEGIMLDLFAQGSPEGSRHWLSLLPVEMIRTRPLLCLAQAITSSYTHPFDYHRIESWAQQALRVEPALLDQPIQHPQIPYPSIRALVAAQLAYLETTLLRMRGKPALDIIQSAEHALSITAKDDFSVSGSLWMSISRANLNLGKASAAEEAIQRAITLSEMGGNPAMVVSALWTQAYIAYWQGRFRKALQIYQRAESDYIEPARRNGQYLTSTGVIYTFWATILREMNQLDAAKDLFLKSQHLAQVRNIPDTVLDNEIGLVWVDVYRAVNNGIQELEEKIPHLPPKKAHMVQTHTARMKLFLGDRQPDLADSVFHWANRQRSLWKPMQQLENTFLIWVQALLLQKRQGKPIPEIQEVLEPLEKQLQLAEEAQFLRSQVQILILQALVHQELSQTEDALRALENALRLAQPEGLIRSIIDARQLIDPLLRTALARKITPDYTQKLLSALEAELSTSSETGAAFHPIQPLIEPLTRREREVLVLVAAGLPNRAIAQQLVLAPGTVKKYISSVFQKLNANRRTQAVARAKELGIL